MRVADDNRVREISKPLFGNAYRLELLAMIGDFDGAFYARQIARQMGVADNLVTSQLGRLCELGLLEKQPASPHVIYTRLPSHIWGMAKQLRLEIDGAAPGEQRDHNTEVQRHRASDPDPWPSQSYRPSMVDGHDESPSLTGDAVLLRERAQTAASVDLAMEMRAMDASNQLRRATRGITALYEAALVTSTVKVTQLPILVAHRTEGDHSVTKLAGALTLDRTTLARNLKVLEERGLIRLYEDEVDARVRMVSLTQEGSRVLDGALARWTEIQHVVEEHFGRDRLKALYEELQALVDALPLQP
jgi:DNA-binding MarR family transcriptional regulator